MPYAVIYALIGYLSGSVLYAEVFCGIFGRKNAIEQSRDANPGTANAFLYGGFWCGICTLIFDMAKGFVPVYAYVHMTQMNLAESNGLALVLAAPVAGHIFPVWHHFKGDCSQFWQSARTDTDVVSGTFSCGVFFILFTGNTDFTELLPNRSGIHCKLAHHCIFRD